MEKERYFGSVRFFKHLFISIFALLVIIPTAFAIGNRIALTRAQEQLAALSGANTEESAVPETEEKSAPEGALTASDIMENSFLISHGLGSVDDTATLNCLEGFLEHYEAGVRIFEADIRLTADGRAVLRHDWRANLQEGVSETSIPTLEEFLELPINGKYTPLSFCDLLRLMEQYPDICIITDTKFTNEEEVTYQFRQMLSDAHSLGLSYLFDRIVIQVYTTKMFDVVSNLYDFPNYIYTLYYEGFDGSEETLRSKAEYCRDNGIMGITMWDYLWDDSFCDIAGWRGVDVYVHTVNSPESARDFLARGVKAVYTDSLDPSDLY